MHRSTRLLSGLSEAISLQFRRSSIPLWHSTADHVGMTSSAISVLRGGRRLATSPPPHAYFVGSAIFHYLGPAFAVLLFVRVEPLGVAWFRIASAAVIF